TLPAFRARNRMQRSRQMLATAPIEKNDVIDCARCRCIDPRKGRGLDLDRRLSTSQRHPAFKLWEERGSRRPEPKRAWISDGNASSHTSRDECAVVGNIGPTPLGARVCKRRLAGTGISEQKKPVAISRYACRMESHKMLYIQQCVHRGFEKVIAKVTFIANGRFRQVNKTNSGLQIAQRRVVGICHDNEQIVLRPKNSAGKNAIFRTFRNDEVKLKEIR